MTFKELSVLERLFERNVYVSFLMPDTNYPDKLVAKCVYRSFREFDKTMCLNFYSEDPIEKYWNPPNLLRFFQMHFGYKGPDPGPLLKSHFSYLFDLNEYSKWYAWKSCGKFWPTTWQQDRHQKNCSTAVKRLFLGGVYQPTATVFTELEDQGVHIPEHLK